MLADYYDIFKFKDNLLSSKESDEFIIKMKKDPELRKDFQMINELDEYMSAKLHCQEAEKNDDFKEIEESAKEDVRQFLVEGKTDKEVLEYLSKAYPENKQEIQDMIIEIEADEYFNEIDDFSAGLVNDHLNDENIDEGLIRLLNQSNKNDTEKRSRFQITRKSIVYWAASVAAVIALILTIVKFTDNTPLEQKIFSEYHTRPYELTGIQFRDVNQSIDESFDEAVLLYENSKYEEASLLFNQITINDENFVQALFYSGLAEFESKDYIAAERIFTRVLNNFDEYSIESGWFLSLCLILNNKPENAVLYLKKISEQKSIFEDRSGKLLKELQE